VILAHLADLHLGYRAYHRVAPGGLNVRERDVARAFRAALDEIIALRPDLVLVAGDVFHSVRPPNAAIAEAFHQFARLRAELPDVPVVVISGNHDAPRSVESGSILRLLGEIPGVVVVEGGARRVRVGTAGVSVLCVPHGALARGESVSREPDATAQVNLLLLHGTVTGGAVEAGLRFLGEYGGAEVDLEQLAPERWDYVALGHYHIVTELASNVWYAGALERTSTNIWQEASGEKGFLTYDTDSGRARFHPVPTRPVLDLTRVSGRVSGAVGDGSRFREPAELDALIRARVEGVAGGLSGKIVRLVCGDVPRELFRALDHAAIRAYKAQALHFQLDVRRPERRAADDEVAQRPHSLEEELAGFLRRWPLSSGGLDRSRLLELALGYLAESGAATVEEAASEVLFGDGAAGAGGAEP
jgi:DNA repair protein SbcD/Mre11